MSVFQSSVNVRSNVRINMRTQISLNLGWMDIEYDGVCDSTMCSEKALDLG